MTKGAETEELLAQLHAGVEALTTGEDWQRMLSLANQMHHYSFGNLLLIASQRPDATTVAGYKRWQSLGRQTAWREVDSDSRTHRGSQAR